MTMPETVHLMTEHRLTIDQYRSKYSLPGTYPMVAARLRQNALVARQAKWDWVKAAPPRAENGPDAASRPLTAPVVGTGAVSGVLD